MTLKLILLSVVLVLILGCFCLYLIYRDHRNGGKLTTPSVVLIWFLYSFHAILLLFAAYNSIWQITLFPSSFLSALGFLLISIGCVFYIAGIAGIGTFKRMSGMDTSKLITTGIYRWSRNPQNFGWGMLIIGIALVGTSGLALVFAAFFWLVFALYVSEEENFLEKVYGDEYREYLESTAKYFGVPKLKKK